LPLGLARLEAMQIGRGDGQSTAPAARRLHLRYPGTCEQCSTVLPPGSDALYDPTRKTVRCLECPPPAAPLPRAPIDTGVAGGSALREYRRRVASRETRIKGRFGVRIGGVVLALTDEPQTTRAWATGAKGEVALARVLADLPGVAVLHDRAIPASKANIDHVVIGPAGVFVVDAKHLQGRIEIRNRGGLFRTDLRLYVGRRDCSALADGVLRQASVVAKLLEGSGNAPSPSVVPVLCFVDGDWPLLRPPSSFRSVRLEAPKSIRKVASQPTALDESEIERLFRALARLLPAR
jgi:hypothetical protein